MIMADEMHDTLKLWIKFADKLDANYDYVTRDDQETHKN